MNERFTFENNLNTLLEYLKREKEITSLTELAAIVGKNKSFISQILSGKRVPTIRIVKQIVERITDKFPEINGDWLLTGEGTMLKEATPDFCLMPPSAPSYEDIIKEKERIITEQASHIDSLKQSLNMNERVIELMSETLKRTIMGADDDSRTHKAV